jgi:ribonuclease-3
MTASRTMRRRRLEKALGHRFANPSLLTEALTHRGAATSTLPSNERLEFLGDRVLGLVMAEILFRTFGSADEGELSRRFTALVRRDALAEVAEGLDLAGEVHFSPSDAESGRANPGLLANACEAVIGALFVDGSFEAARAFIERAWAPLIERNEGADRDAKTRLQEWAQGRGCKLPRYEVTSREGPPHAPQFVVTVQVEGEEPAVGEGPSKRVAEQGAAAAFLARLSNAERKRS